MINHASRSRSNCKFSISRNNRNRALDDLIVIKALKNIRNGQELLVDYGNNYDMNEEGVSYETKYIRN